MQVHILSDSSAIQWLNTPATYMADSGFDSCPRKVELMTESICGFF
jgi:hypothetical protein